ncbi:MAG: 3-keto-5-aminohexanoate cleavage protein [Burkholderiales bacterium]|nr:3-keto-5-aminohexanoate cleavage protein [Burkholderiales bacterium]
MSQDIAAAATQAAAPEPVRRWIEVAVNGPWGRGRQPNIPITVDEIVADAVACVHAGAAIVHVHAYDPDTGRQDDRWETYAEIIGGVRQQVDAIVYPTIPFVGDASAGDRPLDAQQRFAHLEQLALRGLLEWAAIDPGSTNITHWDQLQQDIPGFVYANPEPDVRHALGMARRLGFHPAYAIYEPGFLRLGAALHWRTGCPTPLYRLMFSSDFSFGFPPEDFALTAYLELIDRIAPGAAWMLGGLGVDVRPLIPRALAEGGHVRVGLEDMPLGTDTTNVALVEEAVQLFDGMGFAPARAGDVRLQLDPPQ